MTRGTGKGDLDGLERTLEFRPARWAAPAACISWTRRWRSLSPGRQRATACPDASRYSPSRRSSCANGRGCSKRRMRTRSACDAGEWPIALCPARGSGNMPYACASIMTGAAPNTPGEPERAAARRPPALRPMCAAQMRQCLLREAIAGLSERQCALPRRCARVCAERVLRRRVAARCRGYAHIRGHSARLSEYASVKRAGGIVPRTKLRSAGD